MSKDAKFICVSVVSISLSIALIWLLATNLILAFFFTDSSADPGLYALVPTVISFILSSAVAIAFIFLDYFLLMRYAGKHNKEKITIFHPRRDFAISIIPSIILSVLVIYFVSAVMLAGNHLSASKNASNNAANNNYTTPTPTPTYTSTTFIVRSSSPIPTVLQVKDSVVAGVSTSEQEAAVRTTVAEINHALVNKDSDELYGLLSSQLTAVFSKDSMTEAFSGFGDGAGLQISGDPQISTEWATQHVLYTHDGTTKGYTVVLHLENGEWKLFGTQSD